MTVERIITEMARAWNAGDGAAWAAHFAQDADFVDALGRTQRGRDVIAAEHQKLFDTIYRESTLKIWQVDNRTIGDGTLLVHTASTLRVPQGLRAGEWHAVQTKVFQNGEILAFHNTGRVDMAGFLAHDQDLARLSPQDWHGEER